MGLHASFPASSVPLSASVQLGSSLPYMLPGLLGSLPLLGLFLLLQIPSPTHPGTLTRTRMHISRVSLVRPPRPGSDAWSPPSGKNSPLWMPRAFQPPYKLLTCRSEAAQGLTLPCIFLCLLHTAVFSCFNYVWPFVTPWTVAHQAPLSMGFSRQEYWSGLLCPLPGDLPWPRDWTHSSCVSCITGRFFTTEPSGKPFYLLYDLRGTR